MSFADKTLTCRDCGTAFTFTSGEQEFYAQKGFDNEPTRCTSCRQTRKQSRDGGSGYGGGYSSGGGSYGGGGGGYSSDRGQREMHTVTCSSCGKPAEVPFLPRGDKPVYCSECFKSNRPERSNSRY
ncbi:MAG: zinc-ribbon domain containing protein [Herpetosiphon sp.]